MPTEPNPLDAEPAPLDGPFTASVHGEPPPCFFWRRCRRYAAVEKQGKSVCAECARGLRGTTYPLRPPTRESLYLLGHDAAAAMQMIESKLNRREW